LVRIKQNILIRFLIELVRRYFSDNLSKSGAQFAYFFLFSFFPLLIFFNALIGLLPIELDEITVITEGVIPQEIIKLVTDYLNYLSSVNSTGLLYTGLFLTIYLLAKAVSSLLFSINNVYHVSKRRHPTIQFLLAILFAILFLTAIFAALILLIVGRSFLTFLGSYIDISYASVAVWHILRFFLLAALALGILLVTYTVLPNVKLRFRDTLPGAFFAMSAWLIVSIAFSYYVENMSSYNVLYGSIGAVIVLMLWLYLTGIILILGSEANYILMQFKQHNNLEKTLYTEIQSNQSKTPND